jgi:small-conductance mechanosensitive channel
MRIAADGIRNYWLRAGPGGRSIMIVAALLGWAMLVTRYVGFLMTPGVIWIAWLIVMALLFWIVVRSPRL